MNAQDRAAAPDLPVGDVLDAIVDGLAKQPRGVLHAPPGAGKTTLVPLALIDATWHQGRCVVLEPRRIAARTAAARMAELLGESVGQTVGYTTGEGRAVSAATRVEVVTDGILVRRLQRDASLPGVSSVVFDEFHERAIPADLALAFACEAQEVVRPDLRLLVMSATLDRAALDQLLGDPLTIESLGRTHDVVTRHVEPSDDLARAVATNVRQAMADHDGDVLAFLPGRREIQQTITALHGLDAAVLPLHGGLSPVAQRQALVPQYSGRRVVVSTDIAESSLTVPGVRIVVDSGWARRPAYDPVTGMSRLRTVRISRSSADQRRGRASREGPGLCVRLWPAVLHLDPHATPSLLEEDLTPVALEVAAWGTPLQDLTLLDQPPAATWQAGIDVLTDLGALDAAGEVTGHGRILLDLPVHPRLGHMVVTAPQSQRGVAADVAALLGARDILTSRRSVDLAERVQALRGRAAGDVHRGRRTRAKDDARRIARFVADVPTTTREWPERDDVLGRLVALAYPERVAVRRDRPGSFVMAGGRGARLPESDVLAGEDIIAVAALDRGTTQAWIHLAAALDRESATEMATSRDVVRWGARQTGGVADVIAERQLAYGVVVLRRTPLPDPDRALVVAALLEGIVEEELRPLPWDTTTSTLRDRLRHLHRTSAAAGWPAVDTPTLSAQIARWLGPFLHQASRRADLRQVALADALMSLVPYELHRQLPRLAPARMVVPTGREVRLDYAGERPVLAVKLQELFGLTATPTVAGEPVLLHLLSPAGRPVQITDDLGSFWTGSYADVRAEMRGRYPKHPWPEDPVSADPTRQTKRRQAAPGD